MLTFVKRPRRDQTIAADRKLWTSQCRQYRVAFSRCRYGPRDERGLSDVWRSPILRPGVWNMGCAVETSKPKRRRKSLSTARPYGELSEAAQASSISPSG